MRDTELRVLDSGKTVLNFTVGFTKRFPDSQGGWAEKTAVIRFTNWPS